ncbi:DNA-binding MarR family transcriptional regulator [Pseudochelatococcus lubricantis]|uniref:DNA-binding MarR family transcriptional regulator n=1 Tax=Pseudochelatococcus lubricantis TaxID=1538102 RepID=A0ABX0V3T8_9HYPH|nr:MarR family transcriptional regulator [Pseudochelatococcus lubricantis]NIJ58890.1 DNA-binding MarR family transcriptional regulator [Pseudochelatococcus lubricantis]
MEKQDRVVDATEDNGSVLIDAEFKVHENPHAHRTELRLWLRLLTCANMIETEIRKRLRERFATTLPRFDLMAQLERAPDGMLLGELSRRMMVSNGNLTGLVERLVQEQLVERQVSETDRRAAIVRLTPRGHAVFATMAAEHSEWIAELVGDLDSKEQDALWLQLGALKASVLRATAQVGGKD